MSVSIEVVEPKLFAGAVADEIVASVRDRVDESGRCSIVLAGGSTPGAIYRTLAKPPRVSEVSWSKVVLYWGDERWVPKDDTQSNFNMTQETLLSQLPADEQPSVFAVDTALGSPEKAAAAYAQVIENQEKGAPVFDLVLLGIGEDGHTASIFPQSKLVSGKNSDICYAVNHPVEDKPRITLSPEVLFAARQVLFIVKGESKADVVKAVLEGEVSAQDIPARLYRTASGRVTFFLDSGAALKLSQRS